MFLLQCPKCNNQMKYESRTPEIFGKRKRCVYCGKAFDVRKAIVKKL
ncbi:MAG: hypothetical protein V1702_01420 [Candidatus Woesearchaeota archaeon]